MIVQNLWSNFKRQKISHFFFENLFLNPRYQENLGWKTPIIILSSIPRGKCLAWFLHGWLGTTYVRLQIKFNRHNNITWLTREKCTKLVESSVTVNERHKVEVDWNIRVGSLTLSGEGQLLVDVGDAVGLQKQLSPSLGVQTGSLGDEIFQITVGKLQSKIKSI